MRRGAAAIALLLAACTAEVPGPAVSPSSPASPSGSPEPSVEVVTGDTTALQAMRRLCSEVDATSPDVPGRPAPPPAISEVMSQVEEVRGLEYERAVSVDPVSPEEIDRRLQEYFDTYYPRGFYARRSKAWTTIGAIPGDVGILEALGRYQQGQVLGYYNSQNEELVYTGDAELSRIEQFVLAHELTHAMDDQHFDLDRLDELAASCDDEAFEAALGVVEGSANHFATQVIFRFPIAEIGELPGGDAEGVPQMIQDLQEYPYTDGLEFVDALADEGGTAAVNGALRRFPTTTEEVLHPERFRKDDPEELDVADFAPTFGEGWRDLDVMLVGELWLRTLLDTDLSTIESSSAADGWDGGIYRAWSDGKDVAVILASAWDTAIEAAEFREAMGEWTRNRRDLVVIEGDDAAVTLGFASDERVMAALASAVRSM